VKAWCLLIHADATLSLSEESLFTFACNCNLRHYTPEAVVEVMRGKPHMSGLQIGACAALSALTLGDAEMGGSGGVVEAVVGRCMYVAPMLTPI